MFDKTPRCPEALWLLYLSIASIFIYHGVENFPNIEMMSSISGLSETILLLVEITETLGKFLILIFLF